MSRRSVSPALPMQERVLNSVPSVMMTLISWYSGWMPDFIVCFLAGATDTDRLRERRRIAAVRAYLKPSLISFAMDHSGRSDYQGCLTVSRPTIIGPSVNAHPPARRPG